MRIHLSDKFVTCKNNFKLVLKINFLKINL